METRVSFSVADDYLRVVLAGKFPSGELQELLACILRRAEDCKRTRMLVDAREVAPPEQEFQRFMVGKLISDVFGPPYKLAIVYPPDLINKFGENVAVNRGAQMIVVGTEEAALDWLRK